MHDRHLFARLVGAVNWSALAVIALLVAAWSALTCAGARAWD